MKYMVVVSVSSYPHPTAASGGSFSIDSVLFFYCVLPRRSTQYSSCILKVLLEHIRCYDTIELKRR